MFGPGSSKNSKACAKTTLGYLLNGPGMLLLSPRLFHRFSQKLGGRRLIRLISWVVCNLWWLPKGSLGWATAGHCTATPLKHFFVLREFTNSRRTHTNTQTSKHRHAQHRTLPVGSIYGRLRSQCLSGPLRVSLGLSGARRCERERVSTSKV